MLGCSVSGEGEGEEGTEEKRGGGGRWKKASQREGGEQALGGGPRLGREEVQRIQGKAVKVSLSLTPLRLSTGSLQLTTSPELAQLAFNREVEILASTTQPASTISQFQFNIPTSSSRTNSNSNKQAPFSSSTAVAWDLSLGVSSSRPSISTERQPEQQTKTYYCSTLLVWSHADASRSEAIRLALSPDGGGGRAGARSKAAKAARAGRKWGEKLERQLRSPLGAVVGDGVGWGLDSPGGGGGGATSETEGETEGFGECRSPHRYRSDVRANNLSLDSHRE